MITDVVPAHTTFASATGGGVNTAGTVKWTIPSVAAGGSGSVQLVVTVDPTFQSGAVTNSAVLASPG